MNLRASPSRRDTILYLDGVSVSFDGFKALNNLSFYVEVGELRAIIGPNGAGKTTMMDVVTGKTRPDSGDVIFNGGTDLTKLDEAHIANLGIGRKFQKPTVFESQSVFENLELALAGNRRVFQSLFFTLTRDQDQRIGEVLETIRLTGDRTKQAGDLSHGQKQWLEIGMLLMQEPDLLLVDEPAAGMTDAETVQTAEMLTRPQLLVLDEPTEGIQPSIIKDIEKIIRLLGQRGDMAIVLVEQYFEFARDLADSFLVMDRGEIVMQGTREEMVEDDVRRYLTV